MDDVLAALEEWERQGRRFAVGVLIEVEGSSPREVGAILGVREDGLTVGSVSGGCVEAVVVREALGLLGGEPPRVLEFGPDDPSDPFEVGLTCGGRIRVLVTTWPGSVEEARSRERLTWPLPGGGAFEQKWTRPRLVIVGAVHIAVELVPLARSLGFETIVIDPRCAFADPARFPVLPDRLLTEWPAVFLPSLGSAEELFGVALTHDPKIDDPALVHFLKSGARYVGALGGKASREARIDRFRQAGVSDESLPRLRMPVGLPIGARTPQEIALSIMAEIVEARRGG
ncbi:MAG TPA: XdhC family protein [Fimbriimonadaceae bacterium]|nr:XdhC family protein [Fimbriimonadaceae bacterium]HRJ97125.1 XdhC family protein [Fimbriimonadaceae bacterium]